MLFYKPYLKLNVVNILSFMAYTRFSEYTAPYVVGAFVTHTFYIKDSINMLVSTS